MKRIFVLLILVSLYQGVFSLEITYMRMVDYADEVATFFEGNQKFINTKKLFSGSFPFYDIIDVLDGDETTFPYEKEIYSDFKTGSAAQLGQFAYIYGQDKFRRVQRILVSLVHGTKHISEETYQNLKTGSEIEYNRRAWSVDFYGNSGVRLGDLKLGWDEGEYFGIEFFSGSKIVDLPIEMAYGVTPEGEYTLGMSYDLFTGAFYEEVIYKGDKLSFTRHDKKNEPSDTDPKMSRVLHIFNLVYDGSLVVKTEIRETPSHDGKILGYLNEGESLKVSKAENYEKREGYQDYWYYVTNDSYSGWCIGEFLLIEGSTWYDRFELRDTYVEWDEIPESGDVLKTPLYGLILADANIYELPDQDSAPQRERQKDLESYPSIGSVQKGTVVEVVDTTDFRLIYKIRLEDGTEGWIVDDDIDIDLKGTRNLDTTGIPDESTEVIINAEPVNSKSPERHGVLNDTRVRFRTKPSLDGETLEYLNTGDAVTVIAKTTEKQKIGDMEDYWYKVNKVKKGGYPTGWVYGAFVDFPIEDAVEVTTEKLNVEKTDITVATENETNLIPWVIGGVALLLGAIVAVVIAKKKK